jgi:hypothetical protein
MSPIFKDQTVEDRLNLEDLTEVVPKTTRPLKVGSMCCPEISVTNYQPTSHNIPGGRKSQLHRSGSLISRVGLPVFRFIITHSERESETVRELLRAYNLY